MPVTSCSGTNTKSNFSGHVIITTIISRIMRKEMLAKVVGPLKRQQTDEEKSHLNNSRGHTKNKLSHIVKTELHCNISLLLLNKYVNLAC